MLDTIIQIVFLGLLIGGLVVLSMFIWDALKQRYAEYKRRKEQWKSVKDFIKKLPVTKDRKKK